MKNRISGVDSESPKSLPEGLGMLLLNQFLEIPGMAMLYQVFRGLIQAAGWKDIPPEKQAAVEGVCRAFMLKAWIKAFDKRKPADLNMNEIGLIMTQLFKAVVDEILDDYVARVPVQASELFDMWPTPTAMKAPWISAMKLAEQTDKLAGKMSEVVEKAYATKDKTESLKLRMECFALWKQLRPEETDYRDFYYIGSAADLDQARFMVMDFVASSISTGEDVSPRVFFYGELTATGEKVMRESIATAEKTIQLDKDKIKFEELPIAIFGHSLINADEEMSVMIQSSHITYSAMLMASTTMLKRVEAVTQAMLSVLIAVDDRQLDKKTVMKVGSEAMNAADENTEMMKMLSVYTWFRDHPAEIALLKATETPDGYAFTEPDKPDRRVDFSNQESMTSTVWEWMDGLNAREPAYLKLTEEYGLLAINEENQLASLVINLGFPTKDDPDIF